MTARPTPHHQDETGATVFLFDASGTGDPPVHIHNFLPQVATISAISVGG